MNILLQVMASLHRRSEKRRARCPPGMGVFQTPHSRFLCPPDRSFYTRQPGNHALMQIKLRTKTRSTSRIPMHRTCRSPSEPCSLSGCGSPLSRRPPSSPCIHWQQDHNPSSPRHTRTRLAEGVRGVLWHIFEELLCLTPRLKYYGILEHLPIALKYKHVYKA